MIGSVAGDPRSPRPLSPEDSHKHVASYHVKSFRFVACVLFYLSRRLEWSNACRLPVCYIYTAVPFLPLLGGNARITLTERHSPDGSGTGRGKGLRQAAVVADIASALFGRFP